MLGSMRLVLALGIGLAITTFGWASGVLLPPDDRSMKPTKIVMSNIVSRIKVLSFGIFTVFSLTQASLKLNLSLGGSTLVALGVVTCCSSVIISPSIGAADSPFIEK